MRTKEMLNADALGEQDLALTLIGKNWIIDQGLALKYGYDAALALSYFAHWHLYKTKYDLDYKDEHYWTYISIADLVKVYSCSTRAKMTAGVKLLVEDGVLLEANYNKNIGDKTKWYAINEDHTIARAYLEKITRQRKNASRKEFQEKQGKLAENRQGLAENKQGLAENRQALAEFKQPIPNNITNINTNSVSNRPARKPISQKKKYSGMFDVSMLEERTLC